MPNYLSNNTVYELTDAMVSSALAVPDARDDLLTGINRGYVASLPLRANTLEQLRSDMVEMNGVPYLMGYEVPLKTWLENAVARLRRASKPEQARFQAALDEVALKSQAVVQQAQGIAPAAGPAGRSSRLSTRTTCCPTAGLKAPRPWATRSPG